MDILNGWKGAIEIGSTTYDKFSDLPKNLCLCDGMHILLHSEKECEAGQAAKASDTIYKVSVRQYMTKPSTPSFDFMAKWNNDVPMPLRTMVGIIDKETPGMYHMILHADITEERTCNCMKCGKSITNPVSQYFGMGPECGGHNYTNPFETEDDLHKAVEIYRKEYLSNIKWEGWVIKSAITEMTEIKEEI